MLEEILKEIKKSEKPRLKVFNGLEYIRKQRKQEQTIEEKREILEKFEKLDFYKENLLIFENKIIYTDTKEVLELKNIKMKK